MDPSPLARLFLGFHPPRAYMPLRLVSYSLMHTPWMLIGNLIFLLLVLGLGAQGLQPGTFLRVYSLATVVGGLAYLVISRLVGNSVPYIGAFPALIGVGGCVFVLNPGEDTDFRIYLGCSSPLLLIWCCVAVAVAFRGYPVGPRQSLVPALGAACAGLLVGTGYGFLDMWWRQRSAGRAGALNGVTAVIITLLVLGGLASAGLVLYKEHERLAETMATLRSGTESERRQAAEELARRIPWSDEAFQGLIAALEDPSERVQTAAAHALLEMPAGYLLGLPYHDIDQIVAALGGPVEKTVDLGGGVKMDLVLIPAGEFTMGSPRTEDKRDSNETQHRVRITKPFYMSKHEVTQEQWQAVMGSNPGHPKGATNPVDFVSWNNCQAFVKKLSEKVAGLTFALPTEAEWEYACRAGSTTEYSFGHDTRDLGDHAWYYENSDRRTHQVAKKKPNAFGLYDMHGNVWEWCQDWYAEDYYRNSPKDDPQGPGTGECRVLRGGSWYGAATVCRSASRGGNGPAIRGDGGGFRVVLRGGVD